MGHEVKSKVARTPHGLLNEEGTTISSELRPGCRAVPWACLWRSNSAANIVSLLGGVAVATVERRLIAVFRFVEEFAIQIRRVKAD